MANFCVQLISPTRGVFFYEAAIGLPPLAFLAFLSWHLRSSVYKLRRSQSHIMTTYYSILWAVTLLNVLRFGVQVGSISHHHVALWNIMWLLTRFGMILLEVSVVVFLLHGYSSTGGEALQQALAASGFIAASDTLLKAMFIFVLHIPLFMFGGEDGPSGDMRWSKWGFWTVHTLLFAAVYSAILILPHTQWRDLLPAKPRFYRYAAVLLALNLACTLGAVLIGSGVVSGYCIYGISNWLYWATYPALLYATFLADFFSADAFDIDLEYYAEMREAGCFDEPLLPY